MSNPGDDFSHCGEPIFPQPTEAELALRFQPPTRNAEGLVCAVVRHNMAAHVAGEAQRHQALFDAEGQAGGSESDDEEDEFGGEYGYQGEELHGHDGMGEGEGEEVQEQVEQVGGEQQEDDALGIAGADTVDENEDGQDDGKGEEARSAEAQGSSEGVTDGKKVAADAEGSA